MGRWGGGEGRGVPGMQRGWIAATAELIRALFAPSISPGDPPCPRTCPLFTLEPSYSLLNPPLVHARTLVLTLVPSFVPLHPRSCPRTLVHASFAPCSRPHSSSLVPTPRSRSHSPPYLRSCPRTLVRAFVLSFVPSSPRSCCFLPLAYPATSHLSSRPCARFPRPIWAC